MSPTAENNRKVIILAGPGESTNILFHALDAEFGIAHIIVETPVSQQMLLKRRSKKLGYGTVAGQILFKLLIAGPLSRRSRQRLLQIRREANLDNQPLPEERVIRVESVNSAACIAQLQELNPAVIVVNGTRIISQQVLTSVGAKFINTHAGITPLYRGVHGGYWALANSDPSHCGVSVHLVDPGIDTGAIIAQALIQPTANDNFVTYPLLQLVAGLPLLKQAVRDALQGILQLKPAPEGKSRLWSHPTLAEYIRIRRRFGVC
ncbi:formyl transferase [Hymenobacter lapidiphilus]|uniref:phosphoribosylglycinamide formyltransferase 1 n=1 Tax=Hymenobacter lapidiphilus TaxID=2608003 RepID=A0A7Y7U6T0_9BACT|nr:formyl transferase [Hymenobacter lapidiphilus]NVO32114.1 formyl transferase [Hymenobacter lapidiphilus]